MVQTLSIEFSVVFRSIFLFVPLFLFSLPSIPLFMLIFLVCERRPKWPSVY